MKKMRELFLTALTTVFLIISPDSPIDQQEPSPQQAHSLSYIPPTNNAERSELKTTFISLSKLSLV
jgi:hypothetical protein